MKNSSFPARMLSLLLAVAVLFGLASPAGAVASSNTVRYQQVDNSSVSANLLHSADQETDETPQYSDTDIVRVSIVLEKASTLDAGFSTMGIAQNAAAMRYRKALQTEQSAMAASIEKATHSKLDVAWNLTLAANMISANVPYGQIETIEGVRGVKDVVIEPQYEPAVVPKGDKEETADPNMATSSEMIGSPAAWSVGYTGAGTRVAVIDTGIDTDHQSFSAAGLEYSLALQASEANMSTEDYLAELDLLDAEEIAEKVELLNIAPILKEKGFSAEDLYFNTKIGFGFNYVDKSLDITHDNDAMGEHGSHVEGISAANAYIPQEDGTFLNAYEKIKMQGVAPDAQIITMKVFGKAGGAYVSDYMAAIEDAIVLGCDSVNLSLGSGNPGTSRTDNEVYAAVMENLVNSDTVVTMSAGNSGHWAEHTVHKGLYDDGISFDEAGSPGSYTNSLSVASVNNSGYVGSFVTVGDHMILYTERSYVNRPIATIAGDHEYVFIDGLGTAEDFAALGDAVKGKVMIMSRGTITYVEKHQNAEAAGAIGCIVYNNEPGVSGIDLTISTATIPCVSITQADGALVRAASTPVTDEAGNVLYYTGSLNIGDGMGSVQYGTPYAMSSFTSWGVPGSMELKPEITAPGGSIYSVDGSIPGGKAYELMSGTSMAAPQVAGMAALAAQYIRANKLDEKTGLTVRALSQSLLMSTATPLLEEDSGFNYYPVLRQGAGLANIGAVTTADSYILMAEDATSGAADGKVKAELGDDPERTGVYSTSFTLNNLTDKEQRYTLSADLFTQDLFDLYNEGVYFLDIWTTPMCADVEWTVDGKALRSETEIGNMDFNGDGIVNGEDAQALLDYVTGIRTELHDAEHADLNSDGEINAYDAYLFLQRFNSGVLTLPANGKVEVSVTIRLTSEQKEKLDANYPVGAYVEGFLHIDGLTTAEGALTTSHSIPLLGFYGGWTESSMFDIGTYAEYLAGDETRYPYMGVTNSNAISIIYGNDPDSPYLFGGNPVIPDKGYKPERNAVNSVRGDKFDVWNCAVIRNAANSRYRITDGDGNVLTSEEAGPVTGAYYLVNQGYWVNTSMAMGMSWPITNLEEGDRIVAELTLAPEYYVDAKGNTNWDALGKGATMSFPAVVDNTAPELVDVSYSMTSNALTVTASDNQYVAAVVLFDAGGSQLLASAGAYADIEPGEEAVYVLDMNGLSGRKFLLQVMDYAMNVTTYAVEAQIGGATKLPHLIAYDAVVNKWIGFDTDTPYGEWDTVALCENVYYAATIADHHVFAATDTGILYVMDEDAMGLRTAVGNLGCTLTDMAYNPADEMLYGVTESNELVTIDKLTCEVQTVGQIGITTNTLACNEDGVFYCNKYRTGEVYSFTLETVASPTLLVTTDIPDSQYMQSMEIDPNNGLLYWASYYMQDFWGNLIPFSYLFEIDTDAATFNRYQVISDQLTALIIPEKTAGSDWDSPTDKITNIQLSSESMRILRGTTATLDAFVQPWTATDRTVTWSSSDPSIATVDEKGVITGVQPGQCLITATSNLDPTYCASCTVTVETVKITLHGALQDAEGNPMFFDWDMDANSTWTPRVDIETSMTSATYDTLNRQMFIMEAVSPDWRMHKVDVQTGKILETASNGVGVPLWDMAYSKYYSTADAPKISSIYGTYFMPIKNPLDLDSNVIDMNSYLSRYTHANYLTGIASAGYASYVNGFTSYDTELFYLLDNLGYVWTLYVYGRPDGSYSAYLGYFPSTLPQLKFPGYLDNLYCSMVVGEDGCLYLSYFTGSTSDFYRLTFHEETNVFEATMIGSAGKDVWPVTLYSVEPNASTAGTNSLPQPWMHADSITVSTEDLATLEANVHIAHLYQANDGQKQIAVRNENEAAGSLNSVSTVTDPASVPEVSTDEKTVTVNVTAKDASGVDTASNSGLVEITYDTEALTLVDVKEHAAYHSTVKADGSVVLAYADLEALDTLATLTFAAKTTDDTVVHIATKHLNDQKPAYDEALTIRFAHTNTEIRDAKEATCLEDGYTGDTYCLDCGKLVKKGETIPALGHDFGPWTVTKEATCTEDGTRERSCSRCGEKETEVIPANCPSQGFTDVDQSKWYHEAIDFVVSQNLMRGMSDTLFQPDGNMTRAQMVTVLYRLADTPAVEGSVPFTDVKAGQFYSDALVWAYENGIAKGVTDQRFAPHTSVTREQMVVFFARFAQLNGQTVEAKGDLSNYHDADAVSNYARESMTWAVETGLIQGITSTTLSPKTTSTRAQIAEVLLRYCTTFGSSQTSSTSNPLIG